MRQKTINRINTRLELALERHGKFRNAEHVIKTILLELSEADYATNWQGPDRFVAELLDVATVAIRGAEQFSSAEAEAEAAKPMMPEPLWVPAVEGSMVSGLRMCDTDFGILYASMSQRDTKSIGFYYTVDQARAIRDWLNQFIAASEASDE